MVVANGGFLLWFLLVVTDPGCLWLSLVVVVCSVTDVDCVRSSLFVDLCGGNIWWLLMKTHYDGCL